MLRVVIREVDRIQARRRPRWPPNVHRTPYGRFLGRFNLFGIRWFTGPTALAEMLSNG
jgi:hypothetical protein